MRGRAAESTTRSASTSSRRTKPATRRTSLSSWSKPLLAAVAVLVTAIIQRQVMDPDHSRCAETGGDPALPLPPGMASQHAWLPPTFLSSVSRHSSWAMGPAHPVLCGGGLGCSRYSARLTPCEPAAPDPGDDTGCVPPSVDTTNLGSFGCEVWTDLCIDQVRAAPDAACLMILATSPRGRVPSYSSAALLRRSFHPQHLLPHQKPRLQSRRVGYRSAL